VIWGIAVWLLLAAGQQRDALWVGFALVATFAGYVLMLWINYRYVWGEYGLGLPSLLRFFHVLVLPMFLLTFWIMTPSFRREADTAGHSRPYAAALFVVLLSAYAWLEPPFLRPLFHSVSVYPMRDATESITAKVRALAGNGRVWVFLPNDQPNEFLGRFLQFQLSPTPASVERSVEFWDSEPAQIRQALANFEVIWFPTEGYQLDAAADVVGSTMPAGIYVRQPDGRFVAAMSD
jgi:hypothetical protein